MKTVGNDEVGSKPTLITKLTSFRPVVTFINLSAMFTMSALVIEMSTKPAFASIVSSYDRAVAIVLMACVVLSAVCRLDRPFVEMGAEKTVGEIEKFSFLVAPLVMLDSILLVRFARVMFVDHVITAKLMAVFVLSILPLILGAPVLAAEVKQHC